MEIKIGVRHASKEIVVDSTESTEEVHALVTEALTAGEGGLLRLNDAKGKTVLVPAAGIAYVELGAEEARRVGFGSAF